MDKNLIVTEESVKDAIESKLTRYYGVNPDEATEEQVFKAVVLSVKDLLTVKRSNFREKVKKQHLPIIRP